MDISIVVIMIAVGLFIVREVAEKMDWTKNTARRQTPMVDMKAHKTEIIENPHSEVKQDSSARQVTENPVPHPNLKRLKRGEDGYENGVEVRWKRRTDTQDDPTFVSEPHLIAFLEMHRDYALWYQIVHFDLTGGVLEWIMSQPDCPNAVAAAFLKAVGAYDIYGLTEEPRHSDYLYRALKVISERDDQEGFPATTMRDPEPDEGWFFRHIEPVNREAILQQCETAARVQLDAGNIPIYEVPRNLLSVTPTGPSLRTEFHMDDGAIV